ncbi:hypothetical protein [Burkholderia gladioli]|uniref:hypothetical protein n=1 Tax=Burkholderia gladioli TaxID=28095 RepID=UPI001FC8AA4D|nr:hypothetical protein [Burkholderia gladioli]
MRELAAAYANTCLEGPGGFIYPLFNPLIMPAIELIHDREIFTSFWQRAILEVASLHGKPGKDVLYLDPIDLQTQKFFELLRLLTTAQGADEFAVIILKPDPFGYFNFHFGEISGICS